MNTLRRVLTLIVKEFAMVLRDPKSRFVVVGPPLIQFFIFGYAATFDVTNLRYAVLDESRTPESRRLLAQFEGSNDFHLVRSLSSDQEIAEVINSQQVRLVLHVPEDFGQRLAAGRPTTVQAIVDGRNSNVASIALGYVNAIVREYSARFTQGAALETRFVTPRLVERSWYNENLLSRWYIVAALPAEISTIVVILLASLSVAREREFGTFDQLLVAPFRSAEILVGKAAPGLVFGFLDAVVLCAFGAYWFDVPFRGSIPAFLLAIIAYTWSIVGVGLFISSLSKTMQQALLGSFAFIMPAVILGGFTTPIENMPQWLQTATLVNPLRYVVAALREVLLEGAGTAEILHHLWPLAVIAALTLPAAGWMFKRRSE